MSRMFTLPDSGVMSTWNPYVGCSFNCSYCFARRLAETRLKHLSQYQNGFHPHPWPGNAPHFKAAGEWVFVCSMGDISFCPDVFMDSFIKPILSKFPGTHFLLQSKNPKCFRNWAPFPDNVWLGTTIETNRDTSQWSKAPSPFSRSYWLIEVKHQHKLVSIEPIMDFDMDELMSWLKDYINPEIVFVGADSRHCVLPEPSWDKVSELLARLRGFVPQVIEKKGLERLKNEIRS